MFFIFEQDCAEETNHGYFKKFPLQVATFRKTRGIVGKGETNQP